MKNKMFFVRRPLLILAIGCFVIAFLTLGAYLWSRSTLRPGESHQLLIGALEFDITPDSLAVIRQVDEKNPLGGPSLYNVFDVTLTHVLVGFMFPSLLILMYLAIKQSKRRRGFPVEKTDA